MSKLKKEYKPNNFRLILILIFAFFPILFLLFTIYIDNILFKIYFGIITFIFLYPLIKEIIKFYGCNCCKYNIKIKNNEIVYQCSKDLEIKISKNDVKKITRTLVKNNSVIGILLKNPENYARKMSEELSKKKRTGNIFWAYITYKTLKRYKILITFKELRSTNKNDIFNVNYKILKLNEKVGNHHIGFIEVFYSKTPYLALINPKKVKAEEFYQDIVNTLT